MPTKIEWTDETWNPIRGCSRVSEGCRNCYAEKQAYRFSGERLDGKESPYAGLMQRAPEGWRLPKWNGQIRFVEEHLLDPLRWRAKKVKCIYCDMQGHPCDGSHSCTGATYVGKRIFVNSMSDLFHENVHRTDLTLIFAVMLLCPQHTFQVLTKRAENMHAILTEPGFRSDVMEAAARLAFDLQSLKAYARIPKPDNATDIVSDCGPGGDEAGCRVGAEWPLPNVWLGVSVENQQAADERIPLLLQTPAAVRFVSAEPLLGPVNFRWAMWDSWGPNHPHFENAECIDREGRKQRRVTDEHDGLRMLDWVICGGESGPGARPMHPDWARGLRDQCVAAGVPYFFKQWGEWKPGDQELPFDHGIKAASIGPERVQWHQPDGRSARAGQAPVGFVLGPSNLTTRVGKKAAGHLLDGVEWHQFPEVRA